MLEVLYEDEDLRVIAKPSGMHSVAGKSGGSLEEALQAQFPDLQLKEAGLIQRLDFETSGAVIAAKTEEAYSVLRELGKQRKIEKSYYALCEGSVENGTYPISIWSRYRGSKKVSVELSSSSGKERAQSSETTFQVLASNKARNRFLIQAKLTRGLRHQVRAHLAALGAALIGDELYGAKEQLSEMEGFLLHASSLQIRGQKNIDVSCALPRSWSRELNSAGIDFDSD